MKKIAIGTVILAALGAAAAIAQAPAPAAAPAPPAPPTERQALMRAQQQAQQAFNAIVIGVIDEAALKAHSQTLLDNARKLPALFAPGTEQNDPRAKPEIWTDQAGFKAANDRFIAAVQKAQGAIPDRIAMAEAMVEVGAGCSSCHQAYRVMPTVAAGRGGRGAAPAAPAN